MNILPLLMLASVAFANWQWYHYDESYLVYTACGVAVKAAATLCKSTDKACYCDNSNYVASLMNCTYGVMGEYNSAIDEWFERGCSTVKGAYTVDQVHEAYKNATGKFVNVSDLKLNKTAIYNHPIYSNSSSFKTSYYNSYWTNKDRYGNVTTSHFMGIAFVAFVGFVMLASAFVNWSQRLSRNIQLAGNNNVVNFFRKYINLGIFKNHLNPTAWGYTPDHFETFCITLMCLYTILGCTIIGFHWHKGDTSFATYQAGTSRYWGDRSGIMLSYKFPLLFIFPGRNNIFQWITKWKYGRFVTFHKWLARCVLFEILIHSLTFASQTYALGSAKIHSRLHADWYLYGIVSTVFSGAIFLTALFYIRRHWYDIFKVIHLVFVCFMLWTALIHARSQKYQDFYYTAVAIWCFEYVSRILRVSIYGVRKANIKYFADDNVLRVTIPESRFLKPSPGSHAFLYFLTPTDFFKSHCFTAVPSTTPGYVQFYCKVKNGLTLKLANKLKSSESIDIPVLVEGFYGETSPYQHFDKTVLITGSTGVAGPYAHVVKLTKDSNREVKLYWSVRTLGALEWFKDELLALRSTQCKPIIYVSQPGIDSSSSGTDSQSDDSSEKAAEESNTKESSQPLEKIITDEKEIAKEVGSELLKFVEVRHGRINISEIIDEELKSASGSIAFGACSNANVVDLVRNEVSHKLNATGKKVQYFEEMQIW